MLAWRNILHGATGTTPSTLLFGTGTALPNNFFTKSSFPGFEALNLTRNHFLSNDSNPLFGPQSSYKSYIPSKLKTTDYVWVQVQQVYHLNPRYTGPFKVLKIQHNNTILISKDGRPYTINLEKVKPVYRFYDDSQPIAQPSHSSPVIIPPKVSQQPPIQIQHIKRKKSVSSTNFVRICDPFHPKQIPFRCVRM